MKKEVLGFEVVGRFKSAVRFGFVSHKEASNEAEAIRVFKASLKNEEQHLENFEFEVEVLTYSCPSCRCNGKCV